MLRFMNDEERRRTISAATKITEAWNGFVQYKTEHMNRFGRDELRFAHVPPPITEALRLSPAPRKVEAMC